VGDTLRAGALKAVAMAGPKGKLAAVVLNRSANSNAMRAGKFARDSSRVARGSLNPKRGGES
jgi:hypothetical protein